MKYILEVYRVEGAVPEKGKMIPVGYVPTNQTVEVRIDKGALIIENIKEGILILNAKDISKILKMEGVDEDG